MAKMVLMLGEQDGWTTTVQPDERPDVFYALSNADEDRVKKTKGTQAKVELRERLSLLAYKFDPALSTPETYRMYRCVELDRVRTT